MNLSSSSNSGSLLILLDWFVVDISVSIENLEMSPRNLDGSWFREDDDIGEGVWKCFSLE